MIPLKVSSNDLTNLIQTLRKVDNFHGLTVTIPHKSAVVELCDLLDTEAETTQAVNWIKFDKNRKLLGNNFDGKGFVNGFLSQNHQLSNKIIGLFGREREISARSFPGTKTLPGSFTSAAQCALLAVSRSDADKKTSLPVASITIPRSSVLIGRVDRERETQLTPSVNADCSTVNFISTLGSFLKWKGYSRNWMYVYKGSRSN